MGNQLIQGSQNVQVQDAKQSLIQVIYNQTAHTVPLEPAHIPVAPRSPSPARLVRAHAGVFPYVDRGGILAELERWVDIQAPFGGMVIGGGGGSGKTRLAVELCEKLRERNWLCGFLSRIADQTMLDALVQAPTARLVVVDYAESRAEQLQVLLPLLKAKATREQPVRVLLLVRAAPSQAKDWPARLRNQIDALDAVLDECDIRILEEAPLQPGDREQVFKVAAGAFAERIDDGAPAPAPPNLEQEVFSTPLMIVAAAYLAVHGNAAPPSTQDELLNEMLAHERRYWRQSSARLGADDVLLERLVALATLTSADSEDEAAARLALLPDLSDAPVERRNRLARWVQEQYPGPGWWNPLEPDLLGEHLVAGCFTGHPEVLGAIMESEDPAEITRPLEVLARAAGDHPELEAVLGPVFAEALPRLCKIAVQQAETAKDESLLYGSTVTAASAITTALAAIDVEKDVRSITAAIAALPSRGNLLLNELGVTLTKRQVAAFRNGGSDSGIQEIRLGAALNNHSNWLDDFGRTEEALKASEESVVIWRRLADADPEAHEDPLATALNNLCSRQAKTGRKEEALATAESAVAMRRRSGAAARLESDVLASALNNLSNCLWEVGRSEESLEVIEESVDAYKKLAEKYPEKYEVRLAMALSNLSSTLGDLDRNTEALKAIDQALEIRRPLAARNPAGFQADLARALNNRGSYLMGLESNEEALEPLEDAARMLRPLTAANPESHAGELVAVLSNLYKCLERCGQAQASEAVALELSTLLAEAGLLLENDGEDPEATIHEAPR